MISTNRISPLFLVTFLSVASGQIIAMEQPPVPNPHLYPRNRQDQKGTSYLKTCCFYCLGGAAAIIASIALVGIATDPAGARRAQEGLDELARISAKNKEDLRNKDW